MTALRAQIELIEADRAARLRLIHEQAVERDNLRAEAQAQREQIEVLMAQLRMLQSAFQTIRHSRTYRLLRLVGRWRFIDPVADGSPGSPSAPTGAPK
jgi:hypothetical protein